MSELVQLTDWNTPRAAWSVERREHTLSPPERVWRALTDPAELCRWWCRSADVAPRAGGHCAFTGAPAPRPAAEPAPADFEIVRYEPPERLMFRWPLLGVDTTVEYRLTRHLEETDLHVVQTADRAPGGWPANRDTPNWWWLGLPCLRWHCDEGFVPLRLEDATIDAPPPVSFAASFTTFPWVVWSKLTDPRELVAWWGTDVEIEVTAGGTFRLGPAAPGPTHVIAAGDGGRLVHDWIWPEGDASRVEWTIEETEMDTVVRLIDRGPWNDDAPRAQRNLRWASTLLALKQKSERGISPRDCQG